MHCRGAATTPERQLIGHRGHRDFGARDGSPGYKVIEANPAVRVLRDSLVELRQCCDLLGVGPSVRSRLGHLGAREHDPAKKLMGVGCRPMPSPPVREVGDAKERGAQPRARSIQESDAGDTLAGTHLL